MKMTREQFEVLKDKAYGKITLTQAERKAMEDTLFAECYASDNKKYHSYHNDHIKSLTDRDLADELAEYCFNTIN